MSFKTRDITFMSLTVVLLIAGGYLLYYMSLFFPVPGSKFIVMGAYLSLVVYFPMKKVNKLGTIALVSIIFGSILSIFTFFMGIAIILTGLLTDLTTFIIGRGYKNETVILVSAAAYAFYSFMTSIYVTNVVSGNMLYDVVSIKAFLIVGFIIFILGLFGAKVGQMIYRRIGLRK
jgi:hypothetical protein